MDLQAQLYRVQEHVKLRKDGVVDASEKHLRPKGVSSLTQLMSSRNSGVEARDQKDKLEVKVGPLCAARVPYHSMCTP